MPSPPLVPDEGPIDLAHLRTTTFGDDALEREVLAMFAAQAAEIITRLESSPPDAAELAHKLKGSARAIGANDVAETAEAFEQTCGETFKQSLAPLADAVARARSAIDALLRRS